MADALAKYRNALKRYRKENPKVPYATAQKRVSAEMKSGKVSGTRKKSAPAKKRRIATAPRLVGTTRRKPAAKKVGTPAKRKTIGSLAKATKLVRDIERLEAKRKAERNRELKDVIQLEINACHDQLKMIKHGHRRRSA